MSVALYPSRVGSSDLLDECPRSFHSPYANPTPRTVGINRNSKSQLSGGETLNNSRPKTRSVIGSIAPAPTRSDIGHEHHTFNNSEVKAYCLSSPKHVAPIRAAPPPAFSRWFVRLRSDIERRARIQNNSQNPSNTETIKSTGRSHSGRRESWLSSGTGIRLTLALSGRLTRSQARGRTQWLCLPDARPRGRLPGPLERVVTRRPHATHAVRPKTHRPTLE